MCTEKAARRPFLLGIVPAILLLWGCSTVPPPLPAPYQEDRDLFESESDLVSRKVLEPTNPLLDYLAKRGWDLLDMFSFRLAVLYSR